MGVYVLAGSSTPTGADEVIRTAERAAPRPATGSSSPSSTAGELVALRRTEGAQVASARVAVDKARTAAIFVRPSRELEAQVSGGRLGALALHGAAALTGGVPLGSTARWSARWARAARPRRGRVGVGRRGGGRGHDAAAVPALTHGTAPGSPPRPPAPRRRYAAYGRWPRSSTPGRQHLDVTSCRRGRRAPVASRWRGTTRRSTAGRSIHGGRRRDAGAGSGGSRLAAPTWPARPGAKGAITIVHEGHVRRRHRRQAALVGGRGPGAPARRGRAAQAAAGGAAGARGRAANGANGATFIPVSAVRERFATGGLVLDAPALAVDAGRRAAPAPSSATSGRGRRDARGRGHGDRGHRREARHALAEGDVLAIPNGVAPPVRRASPTRSSTSWSRSRA